MRMLHALIATLRAARRDVRGNVLMLFGFAVPPMTFAVGMGIDYARAMKSQTKLNAIADAAALVAVSKTVMTLPDAAAATYALQMFQIQAAAVLGPGQVQITSLTATAPTDSNGRRTATVKYTGTSGNAFARILGMGSLNIGGTSVTTNATAPDIDFYMLLDVSGSMALPTTTAGLKKVADSNNKSCQFACHSTNDLKGTDATGKQTDLYGVAKSYGLTLRIDEEGTAVSQLTADASSTSSKNGADYRIAISTFRGKGGFNTIQSLTANMTTASTKTTALTPSLYYTNGCPTSACKSTEVGYNDQDTGSSDAFDQMNTLIPTPGSGLKGGAPQAVMFIITDGMRDESRPGGRPEVAIDTAKCTTLKNRGIRIAVLYTEYLPQSLANDSWSQTNVAPYLNTVEPALQACASSGLYTKVSTDQDIYTALDALFQNAVATARITN
ncbi:pilus assembly protein TadG-related protein [Sphingomonas sp. RP10(2022)]|uniref:Pilus assembly protein TadG-related protein n=1 Tax=Sphingomonas liriopis TaxID=2949094 RepID=A0A9X2HSL2_9SPHN|nr:pilus assembly protein TadG-related protein [Sphingomonas liriopis]MCP3735142.1 pilus assembly protein TadG-related protein [Sphingomonas liriopis]